MSISQQAAGCLYLPQASHAPLYLPKEWGWAVRQVGLGWVLVMDGGGPPQAALIE